MQNDLGAPSSLPSRGFASIITLVSDVSKDLEAVEKAAAEPQPPVEPPRPQPVRIAPEPSAPRAPSNGAAAAEAARRSGSVASRAEVHQPTAPDKRIPGWVYLFALLNLFLALCLFTCSGKH